MPFLALARSWWKKGPGYLYQLFNEGKLTRSLINCWLSLMCVHAVMCTTYYISILKICHLWHYRYSVYVNKLLHMYYVCRSRLKEWVLIVQSKIRSICMTTRSRYWTMLWQIHSYVTNIVMIFFFLSESSEQ